MHRQKQTMGYGVMVTLQILVLSFLVRIQVAQLKRSSFEGRFFLLCLRAMWLVAHFKCACSIGLQCTNASIVQRSPMLDSQGCPPPTLHALINLYCVVPPDSHCGWLSRYDRGLLLGLTSSAFLICIGSTLLGKVRI